MIVLHSLTGRDIYYAKYYGKGGGGRAAGEKSKDWGLGKKNEKRRKITLKKALKMHPFGFTPPAANLFLGGKKISKEGGNDLNAQYISLKSPDPDPQVWCCCCWAEATTPWT